MREHQLFNLQRAKVLLLVLGGALLLSSAVLFFVLYQPKNEKAKEEIVAYTPTDSASSGESVTRQQVIVANSKTTANEVSADYLFKVDENLRFARELVADARDHGEAKVIATNLITLLSESDYATLPALRKHELSCFADVVAGIVQYGSIERYKERLGYWVRSGKITPQRKVEIEEILQKYPSNPNPNIQNAEK